MRQQEGKLNELLDEHLNEHLNENLNDVTYVQFRGNHWIPSMFT